MALLKRTALEPAPAHRTDTVDQIRDFATREVHRTRPAPTLPAYRFDQTGGDPCANPAGGQAEALDNLRDSDQNVVFRSVHGAQSVPCTDQSQALFAMQRRIMSIMSTRRNRENARFY